MLNVHSTNNHFDVLAYVKGRDVQLWLKIVFKDVNKESLKPIVDFIYTGCY